MSDAPGAVHVTMSLVIGAPPVEAGAVKAMLALVCAGEASTPVGAAGTPSGVTVTALDAELDPAEFVAMTVHVYAVPFVSPVTLIGLYVAVPVRPLPLAEHVAV